MSRERRREMVDRRHPALSTVRQCALLSISRSSLNYRRKGTFQKDLAVMKQGWGKTCPCLEGFAPFTGPGWWHYWRNIWCNRGPVDARRE